MDMKSRAENFGFLLFTEGNQNPYLPVADIRDGEIEGDKNYYNQSKEEK